MLDYKMDVQEAIDHPRIFFDGGEVHYESPLAASVAPMLGTMGHPVALRTDPWGGGQAIEIDAARGILIGGSDARKDGCALGF